jgi:tetratricopeptide (TPR) repeat protein
MLILVATLVFAYLAFASSFTALAAKFSPATALAWDATAPRALATEIELLSQKKDKRRFQEQAAPAMVAALRREPLNPRAVRLLALALEESGKEERAREGMKLASRISRRDPGTQLWMAMDYAKTGNASEVLRAYDVLLRTQPAAQEAAFRQLKAALADARFRREFGGFIGKNPPWLKAFVDVSAQTEGGHDNLAKTLAAAAPLPPGTLSENTTGMILDRLVDDGRVVDAKLFYLSLPGRSESALTSLQFGGGKSAFALPPVGWQVLNTADVQGFAHMKDKVLTFEGVAQPERRGTIARKLLYLPPGNYSATVKANLADMRTGAEAQMALACLDANRKWTKRQEMTLRPGTNRLDFQIAADCPAQLVLFGMNGGDAQGEAVVTLQDPRLARVAAKAAVTG